MGYHSISMAVLLLFMLASDCQKQVFYMKSSRNSHCPEEVNASQCYSLSTLVSEGHLSMAPNITLLFLPGEHFLEQNLRIENLREFQMAYYNGEAISSESGANITCTGDNNYGGHSVRIQNVSYVKINSISFQSCGSDGNSSGVLQLRSVDHSEIINSKWYESRSSAIFIEDSNSVISDCQLMRGNCCSCSGGGIHADSSNVTFTESNIVTKNSVLVGNGGGLLLTNCNVNVNGNLTVNYNLAGSAGGGMYVENCTLTTSITSFLLFETNEVQYGGSQSTSNSQCVYNGEIVFSDKNTSAHWGGGMLVLNSNCTLNGHIQFSNNSAGFGGGMEVKYSNCAFNGQVWFSNNSAAIGGGGVAVFNSKCTFNRQIEFSDNNADFGGGIEVKYSNCAFNGQVWFSNNSAAIGGGGVAVFNSKCTFNRQIEFSDNNADFGGGIEVKYSNCTFNGRVDFFNNSARYGGGIDVSDFSCTFSEQVELSDNSAEFCRGMNFYYYSNCTFNGQVQFLDNSAIIEGGGMAVNYSNCIFNGHTDFFDNSANYSGGGMAVYNSNCTFNGQVQFSNNSANYAGGGMNVNHYSNCTFNGQALLSSNSAHIGGGGMNVNHYSNCTFNANAQFSCNSGDFGGAMVVDRSNCTFIRRVKFFNNSAHWGGGIAAYYYSNCTFNGLVEISDNGAKFGGGMALYCYSSCIIIGKVVYSDNSAVVDGGGINVYTSRYIVEGEALFLRNSAGNSGGSLYAIVKSNISFLSLVNISSSTAGREGGGILVRDNSFLVMSGEMIMKDNNASSYGGAISLDSSELQLRGSSTITANSAQYGGAIQAMSSKVYISGDHHFESNTADYGGGWALLGKSLVYFLGVGQNPYSPNAEYYFCLHEELNIHFTLNHARQYGGAIWVENTPYYSCTNDESKPRCFIGLDSAFDSYDHYCNSSWSRHHNYSFIATDNKAVTGKSVYGGNIDSCPDEIKSKLLKHMLNESIISNSVSSDPLQVCLCNGREPDCSISDHHIEAFSGEQIPLSLVGVGERNGTTPAVIQSCTDPPGFSDSGSVTQSSPGSCKVFYYTITSDKELVKLMLYPESLCSANSLNMLRVHINIKPCPPGFMLDNVTKSCVCDNTLKKLDNSIECDINSQTLTHQHGVWIGYNQLNGTVIYHPHCPFDYCTQQLSTFTLNNTDNQCRYNRSGLICGACSEGYSLTLGGSKCKKCSHFILLLFFPLALAGVVLVLFLLIFKLTVSMGTINGLIFFANIIGTNPRIFLPPDSTVVLRVFIAWLNLDLGIDTCLFVGLDMYIKVWLQFVFPFYVFTLIGIIIFVSQRSTLFTKCLGSDPVSVLATLILIAYTKLIRTVLTVISFTYIQGFNGSRITVWLYDGNVRYLSGKHIPLFIFALLIMLLLIIPYTVILLFAPYLQHCSKNKFLFWINDYRIKSFLNSYYAPLKDKYRSWIGLLLVFRLCLLVVFVSNSLGNPNINLYVILAIVILPLVWRMLFGTIYTNWYLDALEIFFFMNLCLFSVSSLYVLNTSGNQRALADTLVSVAFIIFVAIAVYHGWRQLTESRWWRLTLKPKWQKYFNSRKKEGPPHQEDSENGDDECEEPQPPPQVITTFIDRPKPPPQVNTFIDLSKPPPQVSSTLSKLHPQALPTFLDPSQPPQIPPAPRELHDPVMQSTTPTELCEPVRNLTSHPLNAKSQY